MVRSRRAHSTLGCLAKIIGITLTVVASVLAFVITFFFTCSSDMKNPNVLFWSLLAGLGAVTVVVGFSIFIWTIGNWYRSISGAPSRGEDQ